MNNMYTYIYSEFLTDVFHIFLFLLPQPNLRLGREQELHLENREMFWAK